ncbi:MAG: hypothetical protein JNN24_04450 [Hyphomicrobium zavarzinii]|jgi:hypothetical protein|uniref:hypothetical protein n=1 Tax=Hyphomicrobium TaxID=81 RepID=UPI0003A5EC04|nr:MULTISPECIES: hypothetical protein [Hyphomicrobium]MBL8845001.1 hypothetical protein [Hyphomicrobium zavarzinii]WBT38842.1 hypothetical protein PE058_02895 [Hyphomicrobium sp. DMF-1]HML42861.1 hypothetical protein [Hyphomicrobium zavarzinii]
MKTLGLFKMIVAAALLAVPVASEPAFAQKAYAKEKPLRGVVRPAPRRGGYSYKYLQGTNTRRFVDPTVQAQTNAGPFDNGFFFSTPNAPHGGDSPYMQ